MGILVAESGNSAVTLIRPLDKIHDNILSHDGA